MFILNKRAVDAMYKNTYPRAEDLPQYVLDFVEPTSPDIELPDFSGVMRRGWRWMFEFMATEQPLTFKEFERLEPALEYRDSITPSERGRLYRGDLLLKLRDHYVAVNPYLRADSFEDLQGRVRAMTLPSSVPDEIARSHYYRIAGLGWFRDEIFGEPFLASAWPHRADLLTRMSTLLEDADPTLADKVAERLAPFTTLPHKSADEILSNFLVFLDARSTVDRSKGELLITEAKSKKKRLLTVGGLDFENVAEHPDPVAWLDWHTSTVLRQLQIS